MTESSRSVPDGKVVDAVVEVSRDSDTSAQIASRGNARTVVLKTPASITLRIPIDLAQEVRRTAALEANRGVEADSSS